MNARHFAPVAYLVAVAVGGIVQNHFLKREQAKADSLPFTKRGES